MIKMTAFWNSTKAATYRHPKSLYKEQYASQNAALRMTTMGGHTKSRRQTEDRLYYCCITKGTTQLIRANENHLQHLGIKERERENEYKEMKNKKRKNEKRID